jgi:hypothetical protein
MFLLLLLQKKKRKEPLGKVVWNGEKRGPNVLVYRQHKLEKMGWCHCEPGAVS